MLTSRATVTIAIHVISRSVKEFLVSQNYGLIERLISVLGRDFALSESSNMRKGGLIGLAAAALGLQKVGNLFPATCSGRYHGQNFQETKRFAPDLIKPVLTCMSDKDSRVRYYACESLYNVMKVCKENILPMFNEIFCTLGIVASDLDSDVRTSVELLDRLMKV